MQFSNSQSNSMHAERFDSHDAELPATLLREQQVLEFSHGQGPLGDMPFARIDVRLRGRKQTWLDPITTFIGSYFTLPLEPIASFYIYLRFVEYGYIS